MSRGRGFVQRGIIASLVRMPFMSTLELANAIYRGEGLSTASAEIPKVKAVRVAANKLEAEGTIRRSKFAAATGHETWELAPNSVPPSRGHWPA